MAFGNPIRNLTLPAGAGPGQTRIVIGPDLPPPLNTYLVAGAYRYKSGIIFYSATVSNDDYQYMCVLETPGAHYVHTGAVLNGSVLEASPGSPQVFATNLTGAGQFQGSFSGTQFEFLSNAIVSIGELQLNNTVITYDNAVVRMLIDSQKNVASGAAGITSVAQAVPGTLTTVNCPGFNHEIEVKGVFDFSHNVGGAGDIVVGELLIDGVGTAGQAIFGGNANTQGLRLTVTQQWGPINLVGAGAHTLQLRVQKAGGTDNHIGYNATHTNISTKLYVVS